MFMSEKNYELQEIEKQEISIPELLGKLKKDVENTGK